MFDWDILLQPEGPWVFKSEGEINHIIEYTNTILKMKDGACLFVMNGEKMKSLNGFYNELTKVLKFPDYFGRNFNALDECMSDLEWLDFSACVLVVTDVQLVFEEESSDLIDGLIEIFENAGEEWSEPVQQSEEWDRSAIPFHVILHSASSTKDCITNLPYLS